MGNDFDLVPTDRLFAKIEENLNSYSSAGLLDTSRFFTEVKLIINKLGIAAYEFDDAIIKVDNHKGEMPCDFYLLDSAWLCDHSAMATAPIMQDKFVMYNTITCETIAQNDSCGTSLPILNNGVIIQATPCNNNNERILDKVTITEYLQGGENQQLIFRMPTLMTLRNKKAIGDVCTKDCKNLFAKSPYEFQILQQGTSKYFSSTLKEATVLLRYYKYPVDEDGLPLIPDNPIIQRAIEYHLMHYFFYMTWLNNDDVNLDRKIKQLEIDRDKYLVDALNYTKLPSFQKSVEMARNTRKRFAAYEMLNSYHL